MLVGVSVREVLAPAEGSEWYSEACQTYMPREPSTSQKRTEPSLPDRLAFTYSKGGRSERQCGQSTAASRTGSAQNGQSLIPLTDIVVCDRTVTPSTVLVVLLE